MKIKEIVTEIVTTTENSYHRFLELTEEYSDEIKDAIIQSLEIPFTDLEAKFIDPIRYDGIEENYFYEEGVDCEKQEFPR